MDIMHIVSVTSSDILKRVISGFEVPEVSCVGYAANKENGMK